MLTMIGSVFVFSFFNLYALLAASGCCTPLLLIPSPIFLVPWFLVASSSLQPVPPRGAGLIAQSDEQCICCPFFNCDQCEAVLCGHARNGKHSDLIMKIGMTTKIVTKIER